MENKTYQLAVKFIDQMINQHGPNYLSVHKAILNNCVNSGYSRNSNEFITYVWLVLNKKFKS